MADPSGVLSAPLDALATLVSESSTFQEWVEEDDAEGALEHIHIDAVTGTEITDVSMDERKTIIRPFALVCFDRLGDNLLSNFSGSLLLCFEANIDPDEESYRDNSYSFTNKVGAIIEEIRALSYGSGYLLIRTISSVARHARSTPNDTEGDYFQQWYRITYGLS